MGQTNENLRIEERAVAFFWFIVGTGTYLFTIGNIANVMITADAKQRALTEKLKLIKAFCEETELDPNLERDMKRAIKYNASHTGIAGVDPKAVLREIPPALKWKVVAEMHNYAILSIPFFQHESKIFLAEVVPNLVPLNYQECAIIYRKGDAPYDCTVFYLCSVNSN